MAQTEPQTRIFKTIASNQENIYKNNSPKNYIKKILDIFNYTELFEQGDKFEDIMNKLCPEDAEKTSVVGSSSDQRTSNDENKKISISDGVFQYIPFRFAAHCSETGFVAKVTIMSLLNILVIIGCILADIATPNSSSSITIKAFIVLLYTNVGLYILKYMLTPGNILFLFYNSITNSIKNSNFFVSFFKFLLFFIVSVLLPLTIVILIFYNTETLINTSLFIKSGFFVFIITLLIIQIILALVIFGYISLNYLSNRQYIEHLCKYFTAIEGDVPNNCELYLNSLLSEVICKCKSFIQYILETVIERFNVALPAVRFLYILIMILGIPIYILAGTITSIYVFLNFIYSFFVYPIFSVNPVFIKILQERGILLTLIFCSLIIISIREAHIFGKDTESITNIMLVVFSFILIFHIYKIINPK